MACLHQRVREIRAWQRISGGFGLSLLKFGNCRVQLPFPPIYFADKDVIVRTFREVGG